MRRRRLALVALVATLLAASAAYVSTGLGVYTRYQAVYARYSTACGAMLAWSPPRAVYTGLYPNQPALVVIKYHSPIPETTQLTVTIPGFTQPQSVVAETASGLRVATFKPPLLNGTTLDALTSPQDHQAQITARLDARGRTLCQVSAPVTLVSRQWIQWRDSATGVDNTPYLAGWVTPQDRTVVTLVGRAAQRLTANPDAYDATPALFGYNQGAASPQQVRDQVNALFDTLQFDYHLRYAVDNTPFTSDALQQVQLPKDVLSNSAPVGMCVETTVILASAIERLGMRPLVVMTATHAFLGVALGSGPQAKIAYWETSDLNGGVSGAQANTHGDLEYAQDTANRSIQEVIDISYERAHGIEPME